MKVHLIDVKTKYEKVDVGTCEWCFGTYKTFECPTFFFKLSNGEEVSVEGWDYEYNVFPVHNLIHFAEWLDTMVFSDDIELNRSWLKGTIMKYSKLCGDLGIKDREGNPIYADSTVLVIYYDETVKADRCYISEYGSSRIRFTMSGTKFEYNAEYNDLHHTIIGKYGRYGKMEKFDSSNLLVLVEHSNGGVLDEDTFG